MAIRKATTSCGSRPTISRKTLRASDFAFRIGGDEFALLLPQTDKEQAATLCRRVRQNFEAEVAPLQMKIGVTLDFGVAVHPRDAETKEALIDAADKQLYALRGSTAASRVIAMDAPAASRTAPRESPAPPAAAPSAPASPAALSQPAAAASAAAAGASRTAPSSSPPQPAANPRKWERVSLTGTKSYAVIDGSLKTATVIDLSYGGVALLLDNGDDVPAQFSAVLHVPILPPLRVSLRKAYASTVEGGRVRMGCAFPCVGAGPPRRTPALAVGVSVLVSALRSQIFHVNVSPQSNVVSQIPPNVIRILINHNVVRIPRPIVAKTDVIWRHAEIPSAKPESPRPPAHQPVNMLAPKSPGKCPCSQG